MGTLTAVLLTLTFQPGQEQASPPEIRLLVLKLRSDDIQEREDATRRLKRLGRAALPELEKTSRLQDAEAAAACQRGLSVYYGTLAQILETLHASRADATYRKAFRRVTLPDLLVLDDCGFDTGLGREAANEFFRLVCTRHRTRSMVVVTNLPFKQWDEFLPSPAQAVALVDRLVDQATILRFTGKPWRTPREIHGAPLDGE